MKVGEFLKQKKYAWALLGLMALPAKAQAAVQLYVYLLNLDWDMSVISLSE